MVFYLCNCATVDHPSSIPLTILQFYAPHVLADAFGASILCFIGPCFQVATGPRGTIMTYHFAIDLDAMKFIHYEYSLWWLFADVLLSGD